MVLGTFLEVRSVIPLKDNETELRSKAKMGSRSH